MDIYVTELDTGNRLRFPMLPESIDLQTGTQFRSYTIISTGEVKIPSGEDLTGVSWKAILPGEKRRNEPYVREWRDPKAIQAMWDRWRTERKKLQLLITETPINLTVYIDTYKSTYKGGYGDYEYSISFSAAKDLYIKLDLPSLSSVIDQSPRPSPPKAKTYTVVKGDSLWKIAQKQLGNGGKWMEIYNANKNLIKPPNYTIYPGQVLTIP